MVQAEQAGEVLWCLKGNAALSSSWPGLFRNRPFFFGMKKNSNSSTYELRREELSSPPFGGQISLVDSSMIEEMHRKSLQND